MRKAMNFFVLVLVTAAFALAAVGCRSQHKGPNGDHPKADHPKADQPKADHPTGEHPK